MCSPETWYSLSMELARGQCLTLEEAGYTVLTNEQMIDSHSNIPPPIPPNSYLPAQIPNNLVGTEPSASPGESLNPSSFPGIPLLPANINDNVQSIDIPINNNNDINESNIINQNNINKNNNNRPVIGITTNNLNNNNNNNDDINNNNNRINGNEAVSNEVINNDNNNNNNNEDLIVTSIESAALLSHKTIQSSGYMNLHDVSTPQSSSTHRFAQQFSSSPEFYDRYFNYFLL